MAQRPKVTVLMSVYNGEEYLRETIDSLLNQTFRDFELLLINDGSTDTSGEIIASYDDPRIRVITNNPNKGLIPSLNHGLTLAQGEYLARNDADDVAMPERLEKQVKFLDEHPEYLLVGSWMQIIDGEGVEHEVWEYPANPHLAQWTTLFHPVAGSSAVLTRLEAVQKAGGYRQELVTAEDYDLWSRISEQGEVGNLPEVLEKYRVHGESVTSKRMQEQNEARFKISSRNCYRYIEEQPEKILRVMSDTSEPPTRKELLQAMSTYQHLLDRFIEARRVDSESAKLIREELVRRVGRQLQSISFFGRLWCVLARPRLFPLRFWLTGKFLWYVLADSWKRRIKGLFGKKHQGIEREVS